MTTEKKLHRIEFHHESVEERVKHFHEFKTPLTAEEIHEQALRCLQYVALGIRPSAGR